ncbi:CGNR zinc finger domain-containing protein [Steroidobacter sp. S1-65]|uniref:CGNR zinc finger domain-containing protein n=1 Tax=Steroidobacter gossypii TaxID=2805490 RepID=A0ABS1WYM7_9GAMM|nr:CGNR zinc finger domain-containing protein [Steroidobacter gossypii]MBM0106087.1 CGNR zinc finger domain-containing protein [Steroidobacter gossypii]
MQPQFIGSHPAADLLNTAFEPQGQHVEIIGDGKALLEWLQVSGLLDAEQIARLSRKLGAKGLDAAAAEVRKLREWARAWLMRWRSAPGRDYSAEIATLNKTLANLSVRHEVTRTKEGLERVANYQIDTVEELLALLASQVADLVTEEDPSLLKSCAGDGCTLWFLDRTKAHRRLFCSAAGCGNRAKVAAFRERQREG